MAQDNKNKQAKNAIQVSQAISAEEEKLAKEADIAHRLEEVRNREGDEGDKKSGPAPGTTMGDLPKRPQRGLDGAGPVHEPDAQGGRGSNMPSGGGAEMPGEEEGETQNEVGGEEEQDEIANKLDSLREEGREKKEKEEGEEKKDQAKEAIGKAAMAAAGVASGGTAGVAIKLASNKKIRKWIIIVGILLFSMPVILFMFLLISCRDAGILSCTWGGMWKWLAGRII